MRRVLLVLVVGAVVVALAWALASLPGRVSAEIGDITFEAPAAVAALGLLLLFVLLYAAVPPARRACCGCRAPCASGGPCSGAAPATSR